MVFHGYIMLYHPLWEVIVDGSYTALSTRARHSSDQGVLQFWGLQPMTSKEMGDFWVDHGLPILIPLIIEGCLEVKLPTIWTDEKQRWEESERRPEKRKSQKKEDEGARKGRKVAKHCVFSNDLWLRRVEK